MSFGAADLQSHEQFALSVGPCWVLPAVRPQLWSSCSSAVWDLETLGSDVSSHSLGHDRRDSTYHAGLDWTHVLPGIYRISGMSGLPSGPAGSQGTLRTRECRGEGSGQCLCDSICVTAGAGWKRHFNKLVWSRCGICHWWKDPKYVEERLQGQRQHSQCSYFRAKAVPAFTGRRSQNHHVRDHAEHQGPDAVGTNSHRLEASTGPASVPGAAMNRWAFPPSVSEKLPSRNLGKKWRTQATSSGFASTWQHSSPTENPDVNTGVTQHFKWDSAALLLVSQVRSEQPAAFARRSADLVLGC
ncbi:hypothetical protein GW7_11790 [Heterocephalus glaber]|uniref:Uncharacterized protein n=1 Tax=Heterocephalus glaber TaxID=10181 RepID=G5AUL5_HETGA|nr:hypothetical protein GW7_11790 [Heterocephalus glaber]